MRWEVQYPEPKGPRPFDLYDGIGLGVVTREFEDTRQHLPYYLGVHVRDVILLFYSYSTTIG